MPLCFTWRSFFEINSEKWKNTSMDEKVRILDYLDKEDFFDTIKDEFVAFSIASNRPDVVYGYTFGIEEIRKASKRS